ncbi:hypothetical protein EDD17DRAFT_1628362 [Pisolithus thermaeus]|nr:hypothetical protein EV401DRAFT_1897306 [Pisolithus croceorrhizus]KAI6156110.1 hypothetical protein EDD17DRAFT_1628362 [Pisolithus thermaeus]
MSLSNSISSLAFLGAFPLTVDTSVVGNDIYQSVNLSYDPGLLSSSSLSRPIPFIMFLVCWSALDHTMKAGMLNRAQLLTIATSVIVERLSYRTMIQSNT